jgi:hypothetical protein
MYRGGSAEGTTEVTTIADLGWANVKSLTRDKRKTRSEHSLGSKRKKLLLTIVTMIKEIDNTMDNCTPNSYADI